MEMESEDVNRRRWSPSSSSSLEEEEEENSLSRVVMKMKHACKLCNKSFPCGRSLGGHMRSHLINNMTATTTHQTNKDDREKVNTTNKDHQMKPNSSISSDCHQANLQKSRGSNNIEMKKWCCRECGKEFQSTKALSGHMKSHAVQREKKAIIASSLLKNHNNISNNHENDSSSSRACSGIVNNSGDIVIKQQQQQQQQQKVVDTQSISDNNEATTTTTMTFIASPDSKHHDRPRRSSRRPRYIGSAPATATANDSVSVSSPNNNVSATNNNQQDQEAEVAMSLVLLSNDLGPWGNHQISQNSSFLPFEGASGSSSSVLKKQSSLNGKLKTNENFSATDEEMRKSLVSCSKSLQLDQTTVDYDGYNYNGAPTATSCNKRKPKMEPFLQYSEDGSRSFECTTCNKSFRSYQALGGHRASHKKTKGCSSSSSSSVAVIGMSEEDITTIINDDDSKSKIINPQQQKQHECPICFKVFPSGQALGGHKRSHVIGQEVRNATTTVTIDNYRDSSNSSNGLVRSGQKNDFLDLNFPPVASTEEDQASNASIVVGFKPPCWVETSHNNHEQPLVGFI